MVVEDDKYVIEGIAPLEPLPTLTLGQLIYNEFLKNIHKKEALVNAVTGTTISYRQLLDITCCLAEELQEIGVRQNTVMAISSENNLQFFIPVISSLFIGSIMAPINQNYTELEMEHCLEITKPEIIFCSKSVVKKFLRLKSKRSHIKQIIVLNSNENLPGIISLESIISKKILGYNSRKFQPANFNAADQVAFVLCSSGTTGLPKGVMVTHTNMMVRYMHTIDFRFVGVRDTFLGILPFFHGYGLITNFMALATGERVIVVERFDMELFLKTIEKYRISRLWIAPPILVLLAKSPLVKKYDLSCVNEITCGAAPLGGETEKKVLERLNVKFIRQGYGLTEATLATHMVPINASKPGSSGIVVPYMKIKIRDPETGRSMKCREVGEICVKGPMVMKGYFGNEEATRNTFTSDGWLLTGDVGYYDEDYHFYIVDRIKELIKYKGYQVAPAELEAILLSHPKIADAGVIGLPDEEAGELPTAFVVLKPGVQLKEKEVEQFVADKVSSQKRLRGGVIFVPAIPKSPTGKILRRELKKMMEKYRSKL